MGSILIRDMDDKLKRKLRMRAAEHGRSMAEEARQILRRELEGRRQADEGKSLADIAREIFGDKGVDLDIPPRTISREPPDFT